MTRLMADTTDHAAPPGYDLYAGYIDGGYRSFPFLAAQYPGRVLSISVIGNAAANIVDVENGDVTPAHAPLFVRAKGSTVYGLFVAGYSFRSNPTPGALAWQRADHGPHGENIDVSEVYDPSFGPNMTLPCIYCEASAVADVIGHCQAAGLTFVAANTTTPPPPAPPEPSTQQRCHKLTAGNPTRSVRHHGR